MLLLIDNYDSFTYNLFQYFSELGADVKVVRNDEISLDDAINYTPEKLVISPGPCTPKEAGISVELIKEFKDKLPILGVCLGHQCLGAAFGASIIKANNIMHGKLSSISHDEGWAQMGPRSRVARWTTGGNPGPVNDGTHLQYYGA